MITIKYTQAGTYKEIKQINNIEIKKGNVYEKDEFLTVF